MDLQTRKIAFVQEFLKLQNEELISALERLLHQKKSAGYQQTAMSTEQFNEDVDQALDDAKNERVTKADDLKAESKKWNDHLLV